MSDNPLTHLQDLGQSVWYDNIGRGLLLSGRLYRMIQEDGVVGLTSNPTIFQKAIADSSEYDGAISALVDKGADASALLDSLTSQDVAMAADLLLPVWEGSDTVDGWVSIEVEPSMAEEADATVSEAHRLRALVGRPNVFVKVPATVPGVSAIRRLIGQGVSINVTLIFALERYEQVMQAYLCGLEDLMAARARGEDLPEPATVRSVASFFVSRVDTKVDALLEQAMKADPVRADELSALRGKAAVANAKTAYQTFLSTFQGPRWEALKAAGAKVQRPLWASTSTKNPAYRDVMYVEELIGADTVNTMPQATIDAFRDHGVVASTLTQGMDEAERHLAALAARGIDMDSVTAQLEVEGVKAFSDSFDALHASLEAKRAAIAES